MNTALKCVSKNTLLGNLCFFKQVQLHRFNSCMLETGNKAHDASKSCLSPDREHDSFIQDDFMLSVTCSSVFGRQIIKNHKVKLVCKSGAERD